MTIEISELPVGFDLLSDDETFLNELVDVGVNTTTIQKA